MRGDPALVLLANHNRGGGHKDRGQTEGHGRAATALGRLGDRLGGSGGVSHGGVSGGVSAVAGGKGGGKPDMARGGGKDADKIDEALAKVKELI